MEEQTYVLEYVLDDLFCLLEPAMLCIVWLRCCHKERKTMLNFMPVEYDFFKYVGPVFNIIFVLGSKTR